VPPIESSSIPDSVEAAIDHALDCLDALALLGEDVEDEWQYVQDLADAWRSRLESVAAARGAEALPRERGVGVVRACAEAGKIEDPHRAIDWLSTFPQVVLVALGERP
jgi:hypothetical protein